ncbi:MAG: acyl carrier protein [Planctomycetia bacterium]|nr:acyl carrier protein [Planctomycetia bacterium]
MDKEAIKDKVIDIIAQQLGRDKEGITGNQDIANDLGADSLDVAELMITFEEEFSIDIEEDNAQSITTVDDVVEQIYSLLNN